MCVLGCYDAIAKRLERLGPVATHILPACTPMLACKGLNSNQFEMAVGIVQGMLETVVAYRRKQIANPSATAIIENKPTHPGGEPDEAEITRRRVLALGGWKPAPAGASPGSKPPSAAPFSPVSATFPGAAANSASPAPAADPSSAFDVFSTPSLSAGSPGAQASSPFSRNMSPLSNGGAIAASAAGGLGGNNGGGRSSPSASAAGDVFQGLSISQKGPAATNGTSGGSSDPFASAGLGDMFGAGQGAGSGTAPVPGGMSWVDDAFGGSGGGGGWW